ncbi:STM4011 family radical SAM protein [Parablautia muri]|uniref:Uncharacterized protein n=1 Tax=Parablautia muri TaxID=2320879 RepID=A0A9X5BGV6_9FIRM|nr:STM4011 family radical SAM protein [Parablautia muri]NBJ93814.1 hypothetical protein [Parablautia muri]
MGGYMLLYRGSLKSCNYHCSYCPFSKHPMSGRELETDQNQWLSFLNGLEKYGTSMGIGALMVVPYGEALIHSWYLEGLAQVSSLSEIDAVGAQTNLSFPVQELLACFQRKGGDVKKLRLWATFHPEMVTVSEFVKKCRALMETGAKLCAGAVGAPENIGLLRQLREELPREIYLWINKMDGLRRRYTQEEEKAFSDIDPYFFRELIPVPADPAKCQGRLLVEGNGKIHTCNISREMGSSRMEWEKAFFPAPLCRNKRCSCFLAYGGRNDFLNKMLFGEYPLFRIPRHPKAVFLDVEGTLLIGKGIPKELSAHGGRRLPLEEKKECPPDILAGLEALYREKTWLLFATTLPYQEAMKRCGRIWHLFRGGIFAGGAHLVLEENEGKKDSKRVYFHFLEGPWHEWLEPLKQKFSFRLFTYKRDGRLYKITLFRPSLRPWNGREAGELFAAVPDTGREKARYLIEGNCMQIVPAKADKAEGVKTICKWLGISVRETFAAGDSKEDEGMVRLCGGEFGGIYAK